MRSSKRNLKTINKTGARPVSGSSSSSVEPNLREQYGIIRKDLLKLREDLSKGYDIAKVLVEKRGLISELLKTK